ncbi:MAG: hypothetical protein E7019_05030 [Alphaproteobacteria bacterium]|nr:hypothetical protein [Alphaproteobacteria bacterium]
MKNIRQIFAIVLLAVFCCLQNASPACAVDEPAATSEGSTTSGSSAINCTTNSGLFSGLVKTGADIFNNLRDLIYVVSGFGIIAVAVGGFFGNLNWKWLGAILIALVVIASTGELINTIVGCKIISEKQITDTLIDPNSAMPEGATQD